MLTRMELRQLRYFIAAAEEGNISRAAQKIFLTQSALSRQIKALEEEIGQCLLERQAHSIRLTPAGETLLHAARELLQHADAVLEKVRAAGRELRLRVGDIFHTAGWRGENLFTPGLKMLASGNWESQTTTLCFSYRFGRTEIKAARQRKTGLEEEGKRVKGKG